MGWYYAIEMFLACYCDIEMFWAFYCNVERSKLL